MQPSDASPHASESRWFGIALGSVLAAYVAAAVYFVVFGKINHDEGWYLYAARLVYQGALPYRDFAFFQPPLLPYVYGLAQAVFGHSLIVGRWTSFALNLVTVLLGTRLAWEGGGRLAALFFGITVSLTPLTLWAFTTTRTEPLIAALLMATAFLLLRDPPTPVASSAALVTAVLAVATRVSSLPACLLVFCWIFYRQRTAWTRLVAMLLPATVAVAALWTIIEADPVAAWFNIISSQVDRHNQLESAAAWSVGDWVVAKAGNLVALPAFFGFVPVIAFLTTIVLLVAYLRSDGLERLPSWCPSAVALASLALAAYLPNLLPRVVFPQYFVPVFPLFLVVIAWVAGDCFRRAPAPARRLIVGGVAGLLVVQLVTFVADVNLYSTFGDPDLAELRGVARYLKDTVRPGATLVTMDTYLAVESGLPVAPGWEMGVFAYFPKRADADGRRLRIMTPGRLAQSLHDPATGAAIFSDTDLALLIDHRRGGYRPFTTLSDAQLHTALPDLRAYHLAKVFPAFGQFRDNLYVLLRVDR